MPVKFKKGSKEAKAHMAKIRAMRGAGAGKHTDTKSHNVNIKVVSGNIGSLPFTGKFLGVDIKARHYYDDIMIDVGSYTFRYMKGDNITVLSEDIAKAIEKKQKQWQVLTDGDKKKILAKVKQFVSTLRNEFPKGALRKNYNKAKPVKSKTIKPVVKKSVEYYKDSDLNKSVRQTGTSDKLKDKSRVAKNPGKRETEWGSIYYERRANRSDKPGSLLGILGAYFDISAINDLDSLKKEYKKLALKYHPDRGGTTLQMQAVNDEYDKLRAKILKGSNLSEDQKKNEIVIDDAIKEVINVLILLPGIDIEVIGKWIWVSGNTYPVKTELKAAGLIFIKKEGKPYWVYKGVESLSRGGTPMDVIKSKYGVHKFDVKPPKSISGLPIRISATNRMKLKRNLKKLVNAINKRPI